MKKQLTLLSVVVAALMFVLTIAPSALAQAPTTTGAPQGSVQNGVYTWPQAGFSLTLPPLWIQYGYKWTELWGPNSNPVAQSARYTNEWIYTPVDAAARPEMLLSIVAYDKAAWDAMAAQGGPLPSVAGEANGLVYTMRTPQSDPYPQGSVDSQRFRDLSTAMAPALSHITIPGSTGLAPVPGPPSPVLTADALANATYTLPGVGTVTLTNGEYRAPAAPGSASQVVVQLTDTVAYGTLNGRPVAVVVLTASTGGSGTFYYLALVVDQGGQPVNVATTLLGDRVKINSVSITGGQIVVDLVTQGPNDPMTAPTLHQVWKYELQGNQLVKVS